jgi:hypothetical protein
VRRRRDFSAGNDGTLRAARNVYARRKRDRDKHELNAWEFHSRKDAKAQRKRKNHNGHEELKRKKQDLSAVFVIFLSFVVQNFRPFFAPSRLCVRICLT